jgi:hypothetical protein
MIRANDLPSRQQRRLAIAAYQQALEHYTPERAPLDYAMTQKNLGNAYEELDDICRNSSTW